MTTKDKTDLKLVEGGEYSFFFGSDHILSTSTTNQDEVKIVPSILPIIFILVIALIVAAWGLLKG